MYAQVEPITVLESYGVRFLGFRQPGRVGRKQLARIPLPFRLRLV
jgi:hypothetical protein